MTINVQSIDHEKVPAALGDDVEKLIDDAVKQRPDIAAQIAAVRAGTPRSSGPGRSFTPKSSSVGIMGR